MTDEGPKTYVELEEKLDKVLNINDDSYLALFIKDDLKPMEFCMEPSEDETISRILRKFKQLVKLYKGHLIFNLSAGGRNTIKLVHFKILTSESPDNYFLSNYLLDCVIHKSILDLNLYRASKSNSINRNINALHILKGKYLWEDTSINMQVQSSGEEVSDFSDNDGSTLQSLKPTIKKTNSSFRKTYSHAEEKEILHHIIRNKLFNRVKGIDIWKRMESNQVCGSRSWQSMKERYLKHIIPKIAQFHLEPFTQRRILRQFEPTQIPSFESKEAAHQSRFKTLATQRRSPPKIVPSRYRNSSGESSKENQIDIATTSKDHNSSNSILSSPSLLQKPSCSNASANENSSSVNEKCDQETPLKRRLNENDKEQTNQGGDREEKKRKEADDCLSETELSGDEAVLPSGSQSLLTGLNVLKSTNNKDENWSDSDNSSERTVIFIASNNEGDCSNMPTYNSHSEKHLIPNKTSNEEVSGESDCSSSPRNNLHSRKRSTPDKAYNIRQPNPSECSDNPPSNLQSKKRLDPSERSNATLSTTDHDSQSNLSDEEIPLQMRLQKKASSHFHKRSKINLISDTDSDDEKSDSPLPKRTGDSRNRRKSNSDTRKDTTQMRSFSDDEKSDSPLPKRTGDSRNRRKSNSDTRKDTTQMRSFSDDEKSDSPLPKRTGDSRNRRKSNSDTRKDTTQMRSFSDDEKSDSPLPKRTGGSRNRRKSNSDTRKDTTQMRSFSDDEKSDSPLPKRTGGSRNRRKSNSDTRKDTTQMRSFSDDEKSDSPLPKRTGGSRNRRKSNSDTRKDTTQMRSFSDDEKSDSPLPKRTGGSRNRRKSNSDTRKDTTQMRSLDGSFRKPLGTPSHILIAKKSKCYTDKDDIAILRYIFKNHAYKWVKGNAVWMEMEERNIVPGRSWHSLKERFRRRIFPRINSYKALPRDVIDKFIERVPYKNNKEGGEEDEEEEATSKSRYAGKKYTHKEDRAILNFISINRRYKEIKAKAMWVSMARTANLRSRTWESLKNRFLQNIFPNLDQYRLPAEERRKFESILKGSGKKMKFDRPPPYERKPQVKNSGASRFTTDSSDDNESDSSDRSSESTSPIRNTKGKPFARPIIRENPHVMLTKLPQNHALQQSKASSSPSTENASSKRLDESFSTNKNEPEVTKRKLFVPNLFEKTPLATAPVSKRINTLVSSNVLNRPVKPRGNISRCLSREADSSNHCHEPNSASEVVREEGEESRKGSSDHNSAPEVTREEEGSRKQSATPNVSTVEADSSSRSYKHNSASEMTEEERDARTLIQKKTDSDVLGNKRLLCQEEVHLRNNEMSNQELTESFEESQSSDITAIHHYPALNQDVPINFSQSSEEVNKDPEITFKYFSPGEDSLPKSRTPTKSISQIQPQTTKSSPSKLKIPETSTSKFSHSQTSLRVILHSRLPTPGPPPKHHELRQSPHSKTSSSPDKSSSDGSPLGSRRKRGRPKGSSPKKTISPLSIVTRYSSAELNRRCKRKKIQRFE